MKTFTKYRNQTQVRAALKNKARAKLSALGYDGEVIDAVLEGHDLTTSLNADGTITQKLALRDRLNHAANLLLRHHNQGLGATNNNEIVFGEEVIGRWRPL